MTTRASPKLEVHPPPPHFPPWCDKESLTGICVLCMRLECLPHVARGWLRTCDSQWKFKALRDALIDYTSLSFKHPALFVSATSELAHACSGQG